jgi:long-subunit acyl-CoA synthetase (AMP-forming)
MDLTQLARRLDELPAQSLSHYENGALVRKPYARVAEDVRRVGAALDAAGLLPGMRVGILAENSYGWIVHELALLERRCAMVCFPPQELAQVSLAELADKYALHLLLVSAREQQTRGEVWPWLAPIDRVDAPPARVREVVPVAAARNRGPHALDPDVYTLVFSSGTSGRLKCLLMSRRGTEVLVEAYGKSFPFRPDDSILVVLPLSNFQQRLMVYTALWYGFDLLVTEPSLMFRSLKEMRPTILAGPPLFYETVENRYRNLPLGRRLALDAVGALVRLVPVGLRARVQARLFAPFHEAFGGRARLLLTGSAPSRPSTLDLFARLGLPLFQVYGLTETGFVSWNLPGRNRPGSVGQLVFAGTVEIAADGEILVRYPQPQSHGYLFVDEQEEQRTFLPDGRIATGDIGRIDDDGYLYILGRKKQIIVTQGGYKVQPEVLEQALEESPEVARAVVFGGDELAGLVGLVSLRQGGLSAEARVRSTVDDLNARLPPPSQISRVVFTTTVFAADNGLLTRNLKVDRRRVFERFRSSILGAE